MKIIKTFLAISIISYLSIMLFFALKSINKHDLSIQEPITCNLKVKGPIYLITYGDGDSYVGNQKTLAASMINKCIDVVYIYRKRHLDQEFLQQNEKLFKEKRGAGYYVWKPYITLKTLEQIPENAIMIYFDAGFKILSPLDKFINNIEGYDIVLVDNVPHLNKHYTKKYLFKLMDMDNEEVHNSAHLSSGMFIMKNTLRTRAFVKKWLEIAQNSLAINDDKGENEHPEFKVHRHDQSILSLLYLKEPHGIKITHIYDLLNEVYLHRRRDKLESLYMLDYVDKNWMEIAEYIKKMPFMERRLYELLRLERRLSTNVD